MDDSEAAGHRTGPWRDFFTELWRRTLTPVQKPSIFWYFAVSIVAIGGAGLWLELGKYWRGESNWVGVRTAAATWAFVLFGSTSLHLLLGDAGKALKGFGWFVVFVMGGVAVWVTFDSVAPAAFGFLCVLMGLWFWCVVNSDDPIFQETNPEAPVGGEDTQKPLNDAGLSQFKH